MSTGARGRPASAFRGVRAHLVLIGILALITACSRGEPSDGAPPPEPLPPLADGFYAGYAEGRLDFPVGIPMSGYAGRYEGLVGFFSGGAPVPPEGDRRPRPFAYLVPPSIGIHTTPWTRAIALTRVEGGREEVILLVKNDIIASPADFVSTIARHLAERSGRDLSQNLFVSASHSHASGGRFWNNFLFASFGGLDTFSPEIEERLGRSIAEVADRALRDREPARIGMGVERGFDPGDLVYHDRRHGNDEQDFVTNDDPTRADPVTGELLGDGRPDGWIKDDRLTVIRVDRADGSPKVALVHFPIHGTALTQQNLFLSRDATGLIEAKAEERIGEPVVHFQGSTGDIQPSEENLEFAGMERLGEVAAASIEELWRSTQTTATPGRLRSAIVTARQDRHVLGYDATTPPYDKFDAPFGAIGCGLFANLLEGIPFDLPPKLTTPFVCLSRPKTLQVPVLQGLLEKIAIPILIDDLSVDSHTEDLFEDIVLGLNPEGGPYEEFTLLFYLRLGFFGIDGIPVTAPGSPGPALRNLAFLAAPGEPTTPWSFETRHKLALALGRRGVEFEDTVMWGYTVDHQGYLLNQEDWITGGAVEIQINPWGPLWGEFVRDTAIRTARALWDDAPVDLGPTPPPPDPVPFLGPTPTASRNPTIASPPAASQRLGTVSASFVGGDPVVDLPSVVVERELADGTYEPVRVASGRVLDETRYETMLTYEWDERRPDEPHLWSFHWQLREGDPLGRFRFHVRGTNYDGRRPTDRPRSFGGVPYELVTQAFEVKPAELATTVVALDARGVEVALGYPPAQADPASATPAVFRALPIAPASATAHVRLLAGGALVAEAEATIGASGRIEFAAPVAPGSYALEIDVEDAFGNTGRARLPPRTVAE